MAAVDLSGVSAYPYIKLISGVGTVQQEINLPSGKLKLGVGSDVALSIATAGVSDGAAMPADVASIPASNLLELELGHSTLDKITSVAIAAQTGTADVTVILERA